ncbi:MAG TPA: hypothetical protein VF459_05930 [Caulobacteraceae bacterium]
MRTLSTLIAAAAISLGVGGAAAAAPANDFITTGADAPAAHLLSGVYTAGDGVLLEKTQYFWGGRRYCWYDGGWSGPGWYYCNYAWRRGYGWGGPVGWRGWGRPGWRGGHGGWHGDHDRWRGDHRGWRGDRGDRDDHWDHGDHHPH